jgi:hypothetical protein
MQYASILNVTRLPVVIYRNVIETTQAGVWDIAIALRGAGRNSDRDGKGHGVDGNRHTDGATRIAALNSATPNILLLAPGRRCGIIVVWLAMCSIRLTYSISQPSRALNDFQMLGFNEDENGQRVFDGILSHTGGGSGDQSNYPIFVSRVDADGNEVAGVRLPPVAAPLATTTGWALRRAGFGEHEGGEADGQYIPFKTTKAERLAAGDPRLSLEERYTDHNGYVQAVTRAARELEKQRFLLPFDVQKYIEDAQSSNVLL